jgi:outer membrane murein-binding lipoprotein Lpp
MKLFTGLLVGLLSYAAWTLSDPAPGESGDLPARLERLKQEWEDARSQGKAAGEEKRRLMEEEFESIFQRHQASR